MYENSHHNVNDDRLVSWFYSVVLIESVCHVFPQRLEESVLRDRSDSGAYLRSSDSPSRGERVPARIRDIITRTLATDDDHSLGMDSTVSGADYSQLMEEKRVLLNELNRVEDMLVESRAQRDEVVIKYNALSEKVS